MVIIHGISGSTQYLLNGMKTIGGKKPETFEDVRYFYNNYTEILSEAEAAVTDRLDERIVGLNDTETRLDGRIQEDIARRTAEVDEEIAELRVKIDSATNILVRWGSTFKCWIAVSLRSRRVSRPLRGLRAELHGVQNEKAMLIRNRSALIKSECSNIVKSHTFVADNMSFFIGAIGEETVINALSRLPDDYHLFNDVNLRFHPPIHWRKMNDYIKTSQIDHIVIGPTGVFLLETKNWIFSDITAKSDKLVYQVRRSSLALWYYLRKSYARNDIPKTRSVVVSVQGCYPEQKPGPYIDITTPNRLCGYITKRTRTLPVDAVDRLVAVIARTV
jgi:hypothetical protein